MPDTTIRVRLMRGVWHANIGQESRRLFGEDWLPCPFTSESTFEDVYRALAAVPANSGWTIVEDNGWQFADGRMYA